MYIKEIKINGFKSFADQINLELNKNFTGIVGPNGSGKSNVVDALKWVMGEQSVKTLRGSNSMSDVIFNGSSKREASRSAKVEIVLDNTDKTLPLPYNEIEIKRIVYRTGENEYYINKEKVRLKDITDLFIDSFSSKESLSIIPQGKISEIIAGSPLEKRTVIEEASGVLKYKKRKEESLRKLAKTNENIERVNMIINELELNLEPLKKESEKATIYKEKKSRLESIEVAVISSDINKYNNEFISIKEEKESLENSLTTLTTSLSKEKSLTESLKVERTNLDNEISSMQKDLLMYTEKLNELNSKKELLKERNKYDKDNTEVKTRLISLQEEELTTNNEISNLNIELSNNKVLLSTTLNKLNDLKNDLSNIKLEQSSNNNEINTLTRKKYELTNKKEILEYNIENLNKVPYSVKSILNNPSLKGIIGTLGSLITLDNKYVDALDSAVGSSLNNVVVQNDKYAKEAINYLKNNNKGRVTFFPMNLIKPKSIESNIIDEISNIKGYIGILSDLVSYDKEYYNIIKNQLGNIIVTTDIDTALSISKELNSKYRVVTLDGEIIHVGGSLTGGSKKTNTSFTDKTELDQINTKLSSITNELNTLLEKDKDLNNKVSSTTDLIYKTNIDLLTYTEKDNTLVTNVNNLSNKINSIKEEVNSLSNNNIENSKELDNVLKEYYTIEKEKNNLELNISLKEENRSKLISNLDLKEETIKKYEQSTKVVTDKINTLNIKEAKLSVNLDNLLNILSNDYNITYERARNNYDLDMDIDIAKQEINEIKKVIKSLGEVNISSIEEYNRVSKRYNFLTKEKEDLIQSENNLLKIINDMDDVMIEKFSTTFKKVNNEFSKVFNKLFTGGNAHLELTDPTNILETGVEIIANPPGKKPGVISLLSGGEKTLTAISLLFAIMNLKDVPFVILDEVESALDEVNVEKFGEYINNYKGKTQLLVITHKKKTMEYVDLLYGITMEEGGVSKLVSVKLSEIKEKN